MAEKVDIAIVGGGMVGMGCALAMAKQGLDVVLLESQEASCFELTTQSFDDRTLVVNPASLQFWQNLGVWQSLSDLSVSIEKVHVSNQGCFGTVNFDAKQFDIPQLGAVVAAKDLVQVLWQAVNKCDRIKVLTSAELTGFEVSKQGVSLTCQLNGASEIFEAALMIASDGARSQIRSKLGLDSIIKSYQRTAIVCNVQFASKHDHCAYERLTQTGPLALLPFHHGRCGLVWSVNSDHTNEFLSLSDEDMVEKLQAALSYRLGKIEKIGQRSSYPIYQVKVPNQISQSVVLMGNAAHTVSPVSAQGLNLAVRGIQRLNDVLSQAKKDGVKLSELKLLEKYQTMSKIDQESTMNYTDDLMTWFQIDSPWVNGLRSAGLVAADAIPSIKKHLFERAGGLKA